MRRRLRFDGPERAADAPEEKPAQGAQGPKKQNGTKEKLEQRQKDTDTYRRQRASFTDRE